MNILSELNKLYDFWFFVFTDPLDWMKPNSKIYDNFLKGQYLKLYELLKTYKLIDFIEKHKNNKKILVSIVILFDQLPRHFFRKSCNAYARDKLSLTISKMIIEKNIFNLKNKLNIYELFYVLLPYQHSLQMRDHNYLIKELLYNLRTMKLKDYERQILQKTLSYARKHRDVIKKFGYYPKRKIVCREKLTKKDKSYIMTTNIGEAF